MHHSVINCLFVCMLAWVFAWGVCLGARLYVFCLGFCFMYIFVWACACLGPGLDVCLNFLFACSIRQGVCLGIC